MASPVLNSSSVPHDNSVSALGRQSEIAELRPRRDESVVVDELAVEISLLGAGTSQAHILRLGELIYRGLYRGKGAGAPQQEAGQASLRRLSAHPLVSYKVTSLWRAVSVYEMSLRLPQLVDHPNLNISHLRAVLGLPTHVQEELLKGAIAGRWTKRALEQRAAVYRRAEAPRGRRPNSKMMVLAREAERLLAKANEVSLDEMQREHAERDLALGALKQLVERLGRSV